MGAPKRTRKKYQKSKLMWNKNRIEEEHELKERYGLKNLRELWRVNTEVSRIRMNIREVLAGRAKKETGDNIVRRLVKYGVVPSDAGIDDLLLIKSNAFLDRRLQSVVFRAGLARSVKQARQIIVHGFIAVDGQKVSSPGYLVPVDAEKKIGYYRPIDLEPKVKEGAQAGAAKPAESKENN